MTSIKYFSLIFLFLVFISCGKDKCDGPGVPSKDKCSAPSSTNGMSALQLMDIYIDDHNIDVIKSNSTLYYVILDPGGDEKPASTASVTVDYVGYYRNDCSFDAAVDQNFSLTNLIQGWQEGIPLIGRCGRILLIVPPTLAYGNNPNNGIAAGEPLVFEIRLVDF